MTQSSDTTLAFYEGHAKKVFEATAKINLAALYPPFLAYLPPYAAILDAGCGSGRDAAFFARKGYRVTAFDYSPAMVKLASRLTGQTVMTLAFQDMVFDQQFHGVWACASLLHVPMADMQNVLSRLSKALKVGGVLYASFKYGGGEHLRSGRLFVDLEEGGFDQLIEPHPELTIERYWKTSGLRPGRQHETWLNVLTRKTNAG